MNNIFDDFPAPLNGMDSFNQWQKVVQSGNFRLYAGQIINTKDHNPWSNHYDVALFEYDESGKRIPIYEVKVLSPTLGFDGSNSSYHTYYENQPVLIMAREGVLDQAVIIGGFNTSGDHKKYLQAGHADKPGQVYEDYQGQKEANQGSVFPYRVAKPQGYVRTVAGTNLTSPHDDPKYYYNLGDDPEDNLPKKVAARPQIAGVEIMNEAGYVNHHIGPISLYSFSQVILLSRNNRENECARLQRHAAFYASMYQKLATQTNTGTVDSTSTLATQQTNTPQNLHGSITQSTGQAPNATSFTPGNDWLAGVQFGDMFSSLNRQPSTAPSTSSWLSELTGQPDLGQLFNVQGQLQTAPTSDAGETSPSDGGGFDYLEALPYRYHLEQLQKLAQMYQEAAAACNSGQAALRDANECTNPCEGQPSGSPTINTSNVSATPTGNGTVSTGGVFTPEVKAYLDLIAYKKASDPLTERGYYSNNGVGSSKGHFTKEEAQQGFPASAGKTNKVGRYQFNRGDWEGAKKGNPAIRAYTPQDQDLIAYWKMNLWGALTPLKQGDIKTAILRGSKEWASLPVNPSSQVLAGYTMEKAIAYYNERLTYHKSNSGGQSPPTQTNTQGRTQVNIKPSSLPKPPEANSPPSASNCIPACALAPRDANSIQPQQQQSTATSSSRSNLELDDILKALNQNKPDDQKVQNIKVTGGGNTWQATTNIANQKTPTKTTTRIKVNNIDYQVEATGGSITQISSNVMEALKKIQTQVGNPNAPLNNPGGSR